MAYDAETFAAAPTLARVEPLSLSILQLQGLPAAKALALYDLATATRVGIVAEIAGHALAGALRRALADLAAFQAAAPVSAPIAQADAPAAPAPRARARKAAPAAKMLDLAAPLADPPRARTATGAFHCVWADGLATFVSAVPWHAAKAETRWAAAFQAADRLRRSRARESYADSLTTAQSAVSGRYVMGPMGVRRESPQWLELIALRPMPALLAIVEESTGAAYEPGGEFGAGDIERARHLESQLVSPIIPGATVGRTTNRAILLQAQEASARDAFCYEPEPAPLVTATAGASVGAVTMDDLQGAAVVINLEAADRHERALQAAYAQVKAEEGINATNTDEAGHALARFRGGLPALRQAAGGESLTRYTFARGTGGRTFTLTDSRGHLIRFGTQSLTALALAV
jgi:hypothetical protein